MGAPPAAETVSRYSVRRQRHAAHSSEPSNGIGGYAEATAGLLEILAELGRQAP